MYTVFVQWGYKQNYYKYNFYNGNVMSWLAGLFLSFYFMVNLIIDDIWYFINKINFYYVANLCFKL